MRLCACLLCMNIAHFTLFFSTLTWTFVSGNDGSKFANYSANQIGSRGYQSVSGRMVNGNVYVYGGNGWNEADRTYTNVLGL